MTLIFQYIINRSKYALFFFGLIFAWLLLGFIVYPFVGGNPAIPADWYRWYGVVGLFLSQGFCGGLMVALGILIVIVIIMPFAAIRDDYKKWKNKVEEKK